MSRQIILLSECSAETQKEVKRVLKIIKARKAKQKKRIIDYLEMAWSGFCQDETCENYLRKDWPNPANAIVIKSMRRVTV